MKKEVLDKIVEEFRQEVIDSYEKRKKYAIDSRNLEVKFLAYADVISTYYAIDRDKLFNETRVADYVDARHTLFWMLRKGESSMPISLGQIGNWCGGKNHATVIHGIKKIENSLMYNKDSRQDISAICDALGYELVNVGNNWTNREKFEENE